MNATVVSVLAGILACSVAHAGQTNPDVIFLSGMEPGFHIEMPELAVGAGNAATFCYFTRVPNQNPSGIRRWSSTMQPGLHHLIVYTTHDSNWEPVELQPEGTLSNSVCQSTRSGWLYSANDPVNMLALPTDDIAGVPLAFQLQPNQPIVVEMYVINPTGDPLTTSAVLRADLLPDGAPFTPTASYSTFNMDIEIMPMSTQTFTYTCQAPADVRFWWLSTRTHHYANSASISDATVQLVQSTNWEHPQVLEPAMPGYQFSGSGLTYSCTYTNNTNMTISAGQSESDNEVCIAVGFFYPASRPSICLNNVGPL